MRKIPPQGYGHERRVDPVRAVKSGLDSRIATPSRLEGRRLEASLTSPTFETAVVTGTLTAGTLTAGAILLASGTLAAPSLAFASAPTTGLYQEAAGAHAVAVVVGGLSALSISNTGTSTLSVFSGLLGGTGGAQFFGSPGGSPVVTIGAGSDADHGQIGFTRLAAAPLNPLEGEVWLELDGLHLRSFAYDGDDPLIPGPTLGAFANNRIARYVGAGGPARLVSSNASISDTGAMSGILSIVAGTARFTDLSGVGTRSVGADANGNLVIGGSPGTGDVVGPAAATDNAVARFNTATGKLLQNSVVTIGDTGAVAGVSTLAASTSVTAPSFIGTADEAILADVALLANEATALETPRTIGITGDLAYTSAAFDGTGNVSGVGTLATVNANVGSFGSATQVATFTVNAKGLLTAAGNVAIAIAQSQVTGLVTALAGKAPLTGTGTSGTWPISISGNAATADLADEALLADVALLANEAETLDVQLNATYLRWRNGANTLDLDVMRVSSSNNVVINAPLAAAVIQQVNGANITVVNTSGLTVTGLIAASGQISTAGNLVLTGAGGKYIAFTRNDGIANVGGIGWHTDSIFYVGGHPSLSGTAGSTVRIYGFSGSLQLGTNAVGDVLGISASGRVGIGGLTAPVKLGVLSGVSTNSISTPVLSFHSDREDFYATINSYRGGDSTRLGLGFSTVDGGALTEWMRLYPNGDLQVNKLAGVGTRVVGVTSSGLLTITSLGSGDVVGPASATNNAIATFSGTGGKTIKNNSGVTIVSNVINASGYSVLGTAGDSGTIDTGAGTWEITVVAGIITNIQQLS